MLSDVVCKACVIFWWNGKGLMIVYLSSKTDCWLQAKLGHLNVGSFAISGNGRRHFPILDLASITRVFSKEAFRESKMLPQA